MMVALQFRQYRVCLLPEMMTRSRPSACVAITGADRAANEIRAGIAQEQVTDSPNPIRRTDAVYGRIEHLDALCGALGPDPVEGLYERVFTSVVCRTSCAGNLADLLI